MAKKVNFHTIRYGNKDGELKFGHIHNDEVMSACMLRSGLDGERNYLSFEKDSNRQGWFINRCSATHNIKCGDLTPYNHPAFYLEAINGDIVLSAKNGRIRMIAENIDIQAKGSDNKNGVVTVDGNEAIRLKTKNLLTESSAISKIVSSGIVEVVGEGILNLYGGLMDCADGATKIKKSKYGSSFETQQAGLPPFI